MAPDPKLLERPPWSALTTMHFALGNDLAADPTTSKEGRLQFSLTEDCRKSKPPERTQRGSHELLRVVEIYRNRKRDGCNFLSRKIVVNPSLQSEPNAAAMSCFESSRSTETF